MDRRLKTEYIARTPAIASQGIKSTEKYRKFMQMVNSLVSKDLAKA